MPISERTESKYNNDIGHSNSKLVDNINNNNKDSFNDNKRKVRFNSFSNPLYKKDEKNHQNSIIFKNYFGDLFEEEEDETEKENIIRTEGTITHKDNLIKEKEYNPSDYSIVLNLSQDKILFNNLQYDSVFIHDIDPFKEKSIQKNQSSTNFNILDELKEEEKKENKNKSDNNNNKDNFNEKSINCNKNLKNEKNEKYKRASVKFDENQINSHKKSTKSKKERKNNRKNKGNDTSRELLKNKFLKFVKKYASNSRNYSLSDDVEIGILFIK